MPGDEPGIFRWGVMRTTLSPSLRGAKRRGNPVFIRGFWIASLRSQ
jgi:hypothetical protein